MAQLGDPHKSSIITYENVRKIQSYEGKKTQFLGDR